jgi:hypothetical protein
MPRQGPGTPELLELVSDGWGGHVGKIRRL